MTEVRVPESGVTASRAPPAASKAVGASSASTTKAAPTAVVATLVTATATATPAASKAALPERPEALVAILGTTAPAFTLGTFKSPTFQVKQLMIL